MGWSGMRWMLGAGIAAAIVGAMASTASAGHKGFAPIYAHATLGSQEAGTHDCPPPPAGTVAQAKLRGVTIIGTQPAVDTMEGEDAWEACYNLQPDGSFLVTGTGVFTGVIEGCGGGAPGTIRLTFEGELSAEDENGAREADETVQLVRGTGTGGLRGAIGAFRATSTILPGPTILGGLGVGGAIC